MDRAAANRHLARMGYPEAEVVKTEGVWYLLGYPPAFVNDAAERCLHVCNLRDLTTETLEWKVRELTTEET